MNTNPGYKEIHIKVYDGLELYGRHYPAPASRLRPLLCLAGLTRNSRDFHSLASTLAGPGDGARPVYTLDTRGRGESQHASDWRQYSVPVEMLDVQDFMASQQLHDAAILGTSRGGLVAMLLAAAQPSLIGAVVLNDIGPVIERDGLLRIAGFVGKSTPPLTWEQATQRIAAAEQELFPDFGEADWARIARERFNDKDDKPAPGYDPALGRAFQVTSDGRVPPLWSQFLALKHAPCLVLRGELSDLLSVETVAGMTERHSNCRAFTVPRQGHAPALADTATQAVISEFLREHDSDSRD